MSASRRKSKGGRPPPPPPETSSPLPSAEGAPVAPAGLTLAASEAQDQADEKIPRTYRRSVVQLALNNMKLANICIGRPVLLTSNNGKQEVCTAWPVAGFPGGKIGLSKITQKNLKVGSGDAITVQPVTGPLLQAEEVELKRRAKDDCVNGDELSASILRSLDGKVVLPGNTLEVTFYGRSCDLMVTKVKGTDGGILRMQNNSLLRPSEEVSLKILIPIILTCLCNLANSSLKTIKG
ncbi:hypothetical protein JRQ81_016744 [Phrynocephalus forsythii]|uniref:CDC48 N-terminal subdomain domain-containing protein n=1 Tax=Phrynocephalus forsythii TaxID=171643 RepID=A0A9Q0XVC7_9SAUR|nr:hypothetical protein JRQ81_016744 [Phrynocephalus forsythii]